MQSQTVGLLVLQGALLCYAQTGFVDHLLDVVSTNQTCLLELEAGRHDPEDPYSKGRAIKFILRAIDSDRFAITKAGDFG